jgi:hypothetical protein
MKEDWEVIKISERKAMEQQIEESKELHKLKDEFLPLLHSALYSEYLSRLKK